MIGEEEKGCADLDDWGRSEEDNPVRQAAAADLDKVEMQQLPPFPSSVLSRFFSLLCPLPHSSSLHFFLHAAAAPAADKVEFPPLYFPPLFHSFFPATAFPAQKLHALLLHALFTAPSTALARIAQIRRRLSAPDAESNAFDLSTALRHHLASNRD